MSEETQDTNDGTWSGLKKTIVGTLSTVIAGGGTWLGVMLYGGGDEEPKEGDKNRTVWRSSTYNYKRTTKPRK